MLKRVCAVLLFTTIAGCSGDAFKPNAVISDIEPNFIAIGRSKQVEIHGDFTKWKDSNIAVGDISFGADISVDAVTVGNEGFLLVTITAAPTAVPGPRDVEVDGEDLAGAFFVNPAFEVLDSTIVQGDYALLDIVGYDTDWLDGRTHVVVDEGDVLVDGSDIFEMTFSTVLSPTFIQAFVHVDPFATAGGRTVTIDGLTQTDSVPGAITVAAAEFTTLAAGNNVVNLNDAGGLAAKFRIPAGTAPSIQQLLISAGTGEPFGIVFDPDLGSATPAGFIGDEFVFGAEEEYRLHNLSAGKDLYLWVWDANWIDDAYFGDIATGDPLGANLTYASYTGTTLTAATPAVDQTIAAPGGLATYNITATNRWNLVTVDVTTPDAGATLDGLLDAARQGTSQGVLADEPADASGSSGDESLTYLAGGGLDAIAIFEAYGSGTQNGAASKHSIVWNEAAVPGMLFTANDIALEIPEEGQVDSTISVNGATMAITAVHVMIDLDHTWRGDLDISIESPAGTIIPLYSGVGSDDRDGLIEAFPDTLDEAGNLGSLATEDANGDWILHIVDSADPDAGLVRGWAISFEGV